MTLKNIFSPDGTSSRRKARVVAQGFSQKSGIDYVDTFASVARMESLQLFMVLAEKFDLNLIIGQGRRTKFFRHIHGTCFATIEIISGRYCRYRLLIISTKNFIIIFVKFCKVIVGEKSKKKYSNITSRVLNKLKYHQISVCGDPHVAKFEVWIAPHDPHGSRRPCNWTT